MPLCPSDNEQYLLNNVINECYEDWMSKLHVLFKYEPVYKNIYNKFFLKKCLKLFFEVGLILNYP